MIKVVMNFIDNPSGTDYGQAPTPMQMVIYYDKESISEKEIYLDAELNKSVPYKRFDRYGSPLNYLSNFSIVRIEHEKIFYGDKND